MPRPEELQFREQPFPVLDSFFITAIARLKSELSLPNHPDRFASFASRRTMDVNIKKRDVLRIDDCLFRPYVFLSDRMSPSKNQNVKHRSSTAARTSRIPRHHFRPAAISVGQAA